MKKLLLFLYFIIFCSSISFDKFENYFKNDKEKEVGYYWQIGDFHLDYDYLTGDHEKSSHFQLCCRKRDKNQTYFAGKYGFIGSACDIPFRTMDETLKQIDIINKKLPKYPNFILYLGDSTAHDPEETKEKNIGYLSYVYKKLNQFQIPVFGTIGNHDGFPSNYVSYRPDGGWFFDVMSSQWKKWLTEEENEQAKKYGAFTHLMFPKLRLISLNTQIMDITNPGVKNYNPIMLDWLKELMESSFQKNERIIIFGHIAPGVMCYGDSRLYQEWTLGLRKLIIQYKDIIVGHFYAHEHQERFLMFNDDNDVPVNVAFLTSSVSTFQLVNPSIRIIKYDLRNYEILDILTFYNDLLKSNKDKEMINNWNFYSHKEQYNLPDFSAKSWDSVLKNIQSEGNLRKVFFENFFVKYKDTKCDKNCQKTIVCSMDTLDVDEYEKCLLKLK